MTILVLFAAIILLLLLIGWIKINPFVSLLLAAFFVGIINGMPLIRLIGSINSGIWRYYRSIAANPFLWNGAECNPFPNRRDTADQLAVNQFFWLKI